jgi:hypothetical protein
MPFSRRGQVRGASWVPLSTIVISAGGGSWRAACFASSSARSWRSSVGMQKT